MLRIYLVVGLILMSGCTYNAPVAPAQVDNRTTVAILYESAFNKALAVLSADGYGIKSADRTNGIITTEKKLVRLDETQGDCGNIWGIPYLKDTRTTTHVAYSLFIQPRGSETSITVNTTIDGIFNAMAGEQTKQLSCYSSGHLEQSLIQKMKQP